MEIDGFYRIHKSPPLVHILNPMNLVDKPFRHFISLRSSSFNWFFFPSGVSTKASYAVFFSDVGYMFTHPILLDLTTLIKFGGEFEL
jgi:hypothetical protein